MPQSFRCESCAAPLVFKGAESNFQRCGYCGTQVLVPAEVQQAYASHSNFGGDLIRQAYKLKEIKNLALGGNKIAAIKLCRETFLCDLKEAKDAVDDLIAGNPLALSNFRAVETGIFDVSSRDVSSRDEQKFAAAERLVKDGRIISAIAALRQDFGLSLAEAKNIADRLAAGQSVGWQEIRNRQNAANIAKAVGWSIGISTLIGIFVTLLIIGIVAVVFISGWRTSTETTTVSPTTLTTTTQTASAKQGFATQVFQFGGEGLGAGQFDDNRSLGVDGEGRVYVSEYSGGRVQVFDADGKFLAQWRTEMPDFPFSDLAVDRAGKVYVIQKSSVQFYEGMTGKLLGKIPALDFKAESLTVAPDNSLWVATRESDLVHLSADGKEISRIKTAKELAGLKGYADIESLAVDGAGNLFLLERSEYFVLKFSPEGKFINRFGGKKPKFDKSANRFYSSPHEIAVDGRGRVYVSDTNEIFVFDPEGRFIETFDTRQAFGMIFNDQNELWIATRPFVTKYKINR